MSEADDIRSIATQARQAVEQWIDAGVLITGFRERATNLGLEWSQLKAAIVAQIKDEEDNGDRLEKLAAKADKALTYADALRGKEKKLNSEIPQRTSPVRVLESVAAHPDSNGDAAEFRIPPDDTHGADAASTLSDEFNCTPAFLDRTRELRA